MRIGCCLLFFFAFIQISYSQSIRGKVVDESTEIPIFGVNVVVKSSFDSLTVAFGFTDQSGNFKIDFSSEADSLLLIFNSMTIQKKSVLIPAISQSLTVAVTSASLDLEEVTVQSRKNPITQKKDTIRYDVGGFSTANDRVLSDVLKRLPGIEVSDDGMIKYQGKPLVKFYIEGLDLLLGRYNLANKNLPVDAVESVEVLENHQPIRVLDSLVFSDRAALNISLKRKNTWIGTGYGGLGGSPFLVDAKMSPMVFREDFQALFSVQGNNVGTSLADEQKTLTLEEVFELLDKREIKQWFAFPGMEIAGVPAERARFNESFLGSGNVLTKNEKGTQVRVNVDFNQERFSQNKHSATSYFLPSGDTVSFVENSEVGAVRRTVVGGLNWNKNESDRYFDNTLDFQMVDNGFDADLYFNQVPIYESASFPVFRIQNKLKLLAPIQKRLFDIRSTASFQRSRQKLSLVPFRAGENGDSQDIYDLLDQSVDFQRFFTDNSIGLINKTRRSITIKSNVGFSVLADQMESNLSIDSVSSDQAIQIERNRTGFTNIVAYLKSAFEYNKNGFQVSADLPFSVAYIGKIDHAAAQSQQEPRVYMEPRLYIKYQISGKFSNSISASKTNEFGTGEDYYAHRIVTSYRTIELSNSSVPETVNSRIGYRLNYKDPVHGWFVDLGASFSKSDRNVIGGYALFESGVTSKYAVDFDNRTIQRGLNLRGSKYLTDLYTTVTFSTAIQFQEYPQFVDESLVEYSNKFHLSAFEIAVKPKKYVGFDAKASLNMIQSLGDKDQVAKINQFNSEMGLELFPLVNHLIRVQFQYISNKVEMSGSLQENSFLDLSYRLTIPRSRMDFTLACQNILNTDLYRNYFSRGFVLGGQELPLRPRQFLAKLNFAF